MATPKKPLENIPSLDHTPFMDQIISAAMEWGHQLTRASDEQRALFSLNIIRESIARLERVRSFPEQDGIMRGRKGEFQAIVFETDRVPQGILAAALTRTGITPSWNLLPVNRRTEIRVDGNVDVVVKRRPDGGVDYSLPDMIL